MAFTYNLASTNADTVLISQVRLEIGDTVLNAGVLPSGGNLQDEEILLKLTEAGRSVAQATTALCALSGVFTSTAERSLWLKVECLVKLST